LTLLSLENIVLGSITEKLSGNRYSRWIEAIRSVE
jgi:hypothetical protein